MLAQGGGYDSRYKEMGSGTLTAPLFPPPGPSSLSPHVTCAVECRAGAGHLPVGLPPPKTPCVAVPGAAGGTCDRAAGVQSSTSGGRRGGGLPPWLSPPPPRPFVSDPRAQLVPPQKKWGPVCHVIRRVRTVAAVSLAEHPRGDSIRGCNRSNNTLPPSEGGGGCCTPQCTGGHAPHHRHEHRPPTKHGAARSGPPSVGPRCRRRGHIRRGFQKKSGTKGGVAVTNGGGGASGSKQTWHEY